MMTRPGVAERTGLTQSGSVGGDAGWLHRERLRLSLYGQCGRERSHDRRARAPISACHSPRPSALPRASPPRSTSHGRHKMDTGFVSDPEGPYRFDRLAWYGEYEQALKQVYG